MFDDILDLFGRRKREHDAPRSPSAPKPRLPFFDDGDDQDERDRYRHEDDRRSGSRPSSHRSERDDHWF